MIIRAKICGLKTKQAVEVADSNGAAMLGFVFCEKSPRNITPQLAGEISAEAVAAKVAVVVDPSDELLAEIVEHLKPDFIQLHGKESEARAAEIKLKYGIPLIRSVSVIASDQRERGNPSNWIASSALPSRNDKLYEYLLYDSPSAGSGKQFDYSNFIAPKQDWMLSGGLTPENVVEAITQTGAQMVDVSSGVESERGVKDLGKIEAFLDATNQLLVTKH